MKDSKFRTKTSQIQRILPVIQCFMLIEKTCVFHHVILSQYILKMPLWEDLKCSSFLYKYKYFILRTVIHTCNIYDANPLMDIFFPTLYVLQSLNMNYV